MHGHFGKILVMLALAALLALSGCQVFNRPTAAPAVSQEAAAATEAPVLDAEAAYTQAAATIIAELTKNAPTPEAVQAAARPTETPTQEPLPPTSTPQPTNTPLPSDTPMPSETPLPSETPTPEASPTATLPPEPAWKLSFTDEFRSGFWPKEGNDSVSFSYTRGGYVIKNKITGDVVWSTRSDQFAGVRLDVTASKISGPLDGYYGVVCNFANGTNYYFLGVGSDGWYGIGLRRPTGWTWLFEGKDTSGIVRTGSAANLVRGDCANGSLSLYVNGQFMASIMDSTFSAGAIGMGVGTRNVAGTEVLFYDLMVYELETATP
ncbi:MAG: hypothetical protein ACKOC5_18430 [Chloroflexota bacterium]